MKTQTTNNARTKGFEGVGSFIKSMKEEKNTNNYFFYDLQILTFKDPEDEANIRYLPPSDFTFSGDIAGELTVLSLNTAHKREFVPSSVYMFETILAKIACEEDWAKDRPYVCYVLDASDSKFKIFDIDKRQVASRWGKEHIAFKPDKKNNTLYIYNV